ncbi:hypothetical protein B0I35DRAFT_457928 [Stachybotrys elegans]|uniref:Zinc finger PHD-type domain-containing protein n=1 Tax=Stachybotrys elegans TaxID=80388 RepID=A0A8K0WWR2_9HYPO|nr:hypothetical protein B0I35DRAFT_457928 [Stachybotrys elegans]
MPSRKRSLPAAPAAEAVVESPTSPLLHRLRNMWHFANLSQWIYLFGKAANIDESLDIEELETECLKPNSPVLDDIALALMKLISSRKGLTCANSPTVQDFQFQKSCHTDSQIDHSHAILDDQMRKQYLLHAPDRNPFGDEETPVRFSDLDVLAKIRILQQLTQWTMVHPERLRSKLEEQRDIDQTTWRIEPYGWDSDDRTYFVLDDNRVYRLTEAPPAQPQPRPKKSSRSARRSSKRRRTTDTGDHLAMDQADVTLQDVQLLLQSFEKTRDENEKVLRKQLADHLMPILEKQEESRKRKELQRERELLNLVKMANAKRSTRIAGKAERQRQEEIAREEEQKLREEEALRRREERNRLKVEHEREIRMASRDQRLKEREARRLQHEDELAQLSEDSKGAGAGPGRISERRRLAEIERNKQALKDLEQDEEDWVFDCICGLHGQVDDGSHSVACERCNVWQHSKCLGIKEEEAERPEFRFVCAACRHHEDEAKLKPKTTIKLKVNPVGDSGHEKEDGSPGRRDPTSSLVVEIPAKTSSTAILTASGHGVISSTGDAGGSDRLVGTTSELSTGMSRSNDHEPELGPATTRQTHEPVIQAALTPARQDQNGNLVFKSPLDTKHIPRLDDAVYSHKKAQLNQDLQNGILSSPAGISPIKHSPPPRTPIEAPNSSKHTLGSAILPPVATLSPSARQPILTPP